MNLYLVSTFSQTDFNASRSWGLYFKDSASPQMEALIQLHDNIMFYLVIILLGVAWIMVFIVTSKYF